MKEKYLSFRKKINAYSYALWLLSWDAETESPSEAHNYRVRQMEVLHKENYRLLMSKERIETIEALLKEEKLDALFKRELEIEKKRVIILKFGTLSVGIVVDGVSEVIDISASQILSNPTITTNINQEFLKGVCKLGDDRLLTLLDIEKTLEIKA